MKLSRRTTTKLDQAGLKVVKLLNKRSFQAFWVGGIVRNILLKRESDNIDIATDATPDQIESVLNQAEIKTKPVGKEFGSILAIVDTFKIEITTFRSEGRYSDNRHPDKVEFIREYLDDAKRRDFTINALYFDPVKKELYDPTGGIKDLGLKLLRFVGDPKKRIDEDGLRMLRGVRLATQLQFKLEKNSFAAIKTRAKYIQYISGERVKAELDKILLSDNRSEGIRLLEKISLLKFISPDLDNMKKVFSTSKIFHLEGDKLTHSLMVADALKIKDLELIYAALFHDVGKVEIRTKPGHKWIDVFLEHIEAGIKIFEKFAVLMKFSVQSRDKVIWLIGKHDHDIVFEKFSVGDKIQLISNPYIELELDLWQADIQGCIVSEASKGRTDHRWRAHRSATKFLELYKSKKFAIQKLANGNLIMKYSKLKPGKQLGQKIDEIKSQIVLGKIKNESDLKNFLEKT